MTIEFIIGRVFMIVGGVSLLLLLLGLLVYGAYNQWLVRILDWKNEKSRREFFELVKEHRRRLKGRRLRGGD